MRDLDLRSPVSEKLTTIGGGTGNAGPLETARVFRHRQLRGSERRTLWQSEQSEELSIFLSIGSSTCSHLIALGPRSNSRIEDNEVRTAAGSQIVKYRKRCTVFVPDAAQPREFGTSSIGVANGAQERQIHSPRAVVIGA
jgi:hypothetical protein